MITMIEFISVELRCFLCKFRTEIVLTILSLLRRISTNISVLQVTISHEITSSLIIKSLSLSELLLDIAEVSRVLIMVYMCYTKVTGIPNFVLHLVFRTEPSISDIGSFTLRQKGEKACSQMNFITTRLSLVH
jgi:hypothetical protein